MNPYFTTMTYNDDDNKGRNDKEDTKMNKKVKVYKTRRSKAAAADDDFLISEQPGAQLENVVDTKKKCSYKRNKQGDKNPAQKTKNYASQMTKKMMDPSCLLL